MFWKIVCEKNGEGDRPGGEHPDGRFVLHRHNDEDGPHLDLRLEHDAYLSGWRIDGVSLEGGPWATEKAPHPVHWLDFDGDAVRQDAGTYAWLERGRNGGVLALHGGNGTRLLRVTRTEGLPVGVARAVCEALADIKISGEDAGQLIRDGATARRLAVERLCGLGRELDGTAFDESVWRKTLRALTLPEIHGQLRTFEVRFDQKYPPAPTSRPETLWNDGGDGRQEAALAILRD
ncbi:MAG TPA: hypothetical protein HPP83_11165 [Candidatus Hydrogenedentes bacterium]|nr:hypothetical protein [Candidatus Hydrogenedentota bacterium]